MNNPVLHMLIGLPGSGKSTYAEELSKNHNANIHSSDVIREELSGNVSNQQINNEVFKVLHARIKQDLKNGKNVIYDACNISYKRRMKFLKELDKIECFKAAIIIATPYEECVKQNNNRDRKLPLEVSKKMYFNFDIPYYYEGWDQISINTGTCYGYYGTPLSFIYEKSLYVDQYNKYHKLTLGHHCEETYYSAMNNPECSNAVVYAARIHDCGKLKTMNFQNYKRQIGIQAHFYNHEKVGSYDSLFYDWETCSSKPFIKPFLLYVAILIRWHMQPHFWKDSKNSEEKYENLWGEELYRDIILLHEADKKAH